MIPIADEEIDTDAAFLKLPQRLSAALKKIRAGNKRSSEPKSVEGSQGIFAKLMPDVSIKFDSMSVESRAPGGKIERLDSLSVEIDGASERSLKLLGEGRTSRNGVVQWGYARVARGTSRRRLAGVYAVSLVVDSTSRSGYSVA